MRTAARFQRHLDWRQPVKVLQQLAPPQVAPQYHPAHSVYSMQREHRLGRFDRNPLNFAHGRSPVRVLTAELWLQMRKAVHPNGTAERVQPLCVMHTPWVPDYRRNRVPGGTFFFTVNLLDRRSNLLVANIDALRDVVRRVCAGAPFHIDAWVVLPDHMHSLWTLPQDDADFPGRWRAIKMGFAKSLPIGEPRSPIMARRGERGIWQRRYWEHTSATTATLQLTWTTRISTRSSMAW